MSSPTPYNQEFFTELQAGSLQSAREIVPLLLDLIQPQTVVDVGCGDGTWLSVFAENGITEYLGIDGDYLKPEMLQISPEKFLAKDLKQPLHLDKTFDLVLSLEVAEHLPESDAEIFIDSLTKLGEIIVFSAAIPYQGGTEHLNEQWADYWLKLFQQRGFQVIDCLRRKIWDNPRIEPWYAQNLLVFLPGNSLSQYPRLAAEIKDTSLAQLSIVHPQIYLSKIPQIDKDTQQQIKEQNPAVTTTEISELSIGKNRFGSLKLEIIEVNLLNLAGELVTAIDCGTFLAIILEYRANEEINNPIFGVKISRVDGLVCYDTHTSATELSLQIARKGRIKLYLERLDLNAGQYYIDVGAYEQNWASTYDYHWQVYPLSIRAAKEEKGIICPPHHWTVEETAR
ncbi:Wzt carbohydrate-binding domain-containing protein [Oscillatoria salina]|uniref:Wzt carbohydrate-binding domain-containing protein n=1 Tax=Oscillatoria salina TaxID=331517 RepID=UPI0013B7CFF5|nr:Wzt carbohydrate-binding domain-containing protein [Oscillatoria salina]MBZ8179983.1 methyltransferase domain-containing protein [Oscillatoria salina IIICB1]NET86793.1 methyltransferase domain-containing protein [Kamptonema sp. SIO1D9]